MSNHNFVPVDNWGKDHWSTLAYIETVMVDVAGFQVGYDARMRQNRRNYRVMQEQCPKPKRTSSSSRGVVMDPKYGSRLKDGSFLEGHDDWECVQDMAAEGFFTVGPDGVQPGETLTFSAKGLHTAQRLRAHKAEGGSFQTFAMLGLHHVEDDTTNQ